MDDGGAIYDQGWNDYVRGRTSPTHNPYEPGTFAHDRWEDGRQTASEIVGGEPSPLLKKLRGDQ
jgi:hypothetical protein